MAASRPSVIAARVLFACASVLLLTACGGAHRGALSGAATRTPIALSAEERERMRAGMRLYLECVEGITEALGESRMAGVARNAKRCGTDMIEGVSVPDVLALTPEFLALSLDTHQKFDALAHEAAEHGTKASALKQLGAILANCTGCHAAYRFGR